MADKHLSRRSHRMLSIGGRRIEDAWWYEEARGLTVVTLVPGQYGIRWSSLRAALARKDQKDV